MTHCPACKVTMRVVMESGVSIDVCDICHGVWLDAGELDRLTHNADFPSHRLEHSTALQLECPQCAKDSFARVETPNASFVICVDCKGVFVSGSTFDELTAQKSGSEPRSKVENAVLETPGILASLGDILMFFG